MLKYAVCEIGGNQYKLIPGVAMDIVFKALPNQKFEVPVLILKDEKIKIGNPYLKEKISIRCLENFKGTKIRVAKFHAKANYRRVRGSRESLAKVVWDLPAGRQGVKKA